GTLGFLQLTATDHNNSTHLGATFGIGIDSGEAFHPEWDKTNLTDKYALGFADLGSISIAPLIGAQALVDLDCQLGLSDALLSSASSTFPSVVAEFVLDWSVGDRDKNQLVKLSDLNGDFLSHGLQFVGFKHVGLDLGAYFSHFIKPIAEK